MKNPEAVAWFIAAEGCISIYKNLRSGGGTYQFVPGVAVGNTDLELLKNFRELSGYGSIYNSQSYPQTNWKQSYQWRLQKKDNLIRFLKEIISFLPSKQEQAEIVIQFCERRGKRLQRLKPGEYWKPIYDEVDYAFVERLHVLNKRGRL